ncbi:MAG: transposase [Proteobacteria bacterium]|nr:transposase [Pseudomonadota bacterium]
MDTRRRRTREEKLAIVAETRSAPVSRVARKHGVASGLVFRWRKQFGAGPKRSSQARACETGFIPVALPAPLALQTSSVPTHDAIEIVLASGHRVIVGRDVDGDALKRVVEALRTA